VRRSVVPAHRSPGAVSFAATGEGRVGHVVLLVTAAPVVPVRPELEAVQTSPRMRRAALPCAGLQKSERSVTTVLESIWERMGEVMQGGV
jgi:hypothetical protein